MIAGFKHAATEPQYEWMRAFFADRGYTVHVPEIDWNNKVMSDYVRQFSEYFGQHKSDTNHVLGFSFGAMIALITAPELKPDRLLLCSLSPYFSEDLGTLKPSWEKVLGHRRLSDFENFKAKALARQVAAPTTIIYGSHEAKLYPQLKKRCEETAGIITGSKLLVAENAPHEIDFPTYVDVIKSEF